MSFPPQIRCLGAGLDYESETQRAFTAVVTATDAGTPALSGTAIVHVSVLDENDNAPLFQPAHYNFTLVKLPAADSRLDQFVGTVFASDK